MSTPFVSFTHPKQNSFPAQAEQQHFDGIISRNAEGMETNISACLHLTKTLIIFIQLPKEGKTKPSSLPSGNLT
jgi:hypothetical protein